MAFAIGGDLRALVPRRLRRLPAAHRRALLLTLLSLAVWTFWNAKLAWLSLILFLLREFAGWHLVIPRAWLAAPAQPNRVRAIRLAFLMTVAALVLGEGFAPNWLRLLYASALPP